MPQPDDPNYEYEVVTRGWDRLEKGDTAEAMRLFREAVNTNPHSDDARRGMYEAVKQRYWGYRIAFAVVNWIGHASIRTRLIVVVAVVFVQQLLVWWLKDDPQYAPLLRVIDVSFLLLFVLLISLKSVLVAAMIPHSYARTVLEPEEIREGVAVLILGVIGTPAYLIGVLASESIGVAALYISIACFATIPPVMVCFRRDGWPRWLLCVASLGNWILFVRVVVHLIELDQAGNQFEVVAAGQAMLSAIDVQLGAHLAVLLLAAVFDVAKRMRDG
jgi:hypothetical protein